MSESEIRRIKRRKKVKRSVRRTFLGIILAPGKMPRITAERANAIMRACEWAAIMFVTILMVHLGAPSIVGVTAVIVCGAIFAGLLLLIGLADYQDKLAEYELYGFKI